MKLWRFELLLEKQNGDDSTMIELAAFWDEVKELFEKKGYNVAGSIKRDEG